MSWTQVAQEELTPAERLEASEKINSEVMQTASIMTPRELAEKVAQGRAKERKVKPKADMVNAPPHYTVGGIETIDYIKAKLTPEEFIGYLKGNVIKYTSRAGKKDDIVQDLEKAQWYMNRQIKALKGE
jgi:hypothetical protein